MAGVILKEGRLSIHMPFTILKFYIDSVILSDY